MNHPAPPRLRPLWQPIFGRSAIVAEASGFYQPADGGRPAAILAVHDRDGEVSDLAAWFPDEPGRWWLRRRAVPILGEAEIERARCLDVPLLLLPSPADWLFHHRPNHQWPACCVLDWSVDPRIAFGGVRIVAHGHAVLRQLEAAQRRHDRPLSIRLADHGGRRAAA